MDTAIRDTTRIKRGANSRTRKSAERGFSLLEVVMSMAVLTVGLVSLLGVFGLAMASTQTSQEDLIAKQLANEAYDSLVTARNTSQITWDDIQNVGSTNCPISGLSSCGKFVVGLSTIYNSGADGIFGTSDDSVAGVEVLEEPGPDGTYGDVDDVMLPLTGYQRNIQIAPLYDASGNVVASLRAVTITMQYSTGQSKNAKTYVLNSYISEFQ
jgi:prepilin-type N-terminal cleavage/methylation domain-containing protein